MNFGKYTNIYETQNFVKIKNISISLVSFLVLLIQSLYFPLEATIVLIFFFCQRLILPIIEFHTNRIMHHK